MNRRRSDRYEAALRRLPDAYSLALRLTDAGVPEEVICQHLQIEHEGLGVLIAVAKEKLASEMNRPHAR